MTEKTEDAMSTSESGAGVNWEQLEVDSARYAVDSTRLSNRLQAIETRLQSLPGKFAFDRTISADVSVSFDRSGSIWSLYFKRANGNWASLPNMNVTEKAKLASGLTTFLKHMSVEANRRAKMVADGLASLEDMESLLGDMVEEGE